MSAEIVKVTFHPECIVRPERPGYVVRDQDGELVVPFAWENEADAQALANGLTLHPRRVYRVSVEQVTLPPLYRWERDTTRHSWVEVQS